MSKSSEINILLTLLIMLTLLSFVRSLIYILFNNSLMDLDKKFGFRLDVILEGIFLIFATIRIYLISIVFIKRTFYNDLLTYALIYLFLSALVRFYYGYLYFKSPNHQHKHLEIIETYHDIDNICIFIASTIIIRFVFL